MLRLGKLIEVTSQCHEGARVERRSVGGARPAQRRERRAQLERREHGSAEADGRDQRDHERRCVRQDGGAEETGADQDR